MRKVFPLSFKGKNLKAVILSTLIYTLIVITLAVIAFVINIFDLPSAVNTVVNILRQFALLYCVSGIAIAILNAADLLEKKD